FDKKSGKVFSAEGLDITKFFQPKEDKASDSARYAEFYARINKGTATPDEKLEFQGLKERATLAGTTSFNLRNERDTAPVEISNDSREFRIAQDLAYGKLKDVV